MSGLFGGECPVCPAHEKHIAFLQAQVESLQAKLLEFASPGATARMAPKAPREDKEQHRGPQTFNPARLAQLRGAAAVVNQAIAQGRDPLEVRDEIERGFRN